MRFYQIEPTLENYWRGIILFGKNVASYKFALAHALYDIRRDGSDLIRLEELAVPFSRICVAILSTPPNRSRRQKASFSAFAAASIARR